MEAVDVIPESRLLVGRSGLGDDMVVDFLSPQRGVRPRHGGVVTVHSLSCLGQFHQKVATGLALRRSALGVRMILDCHVIPFSGWMPNAHWTGSLAALMPFTE